MFSGIFKKLTLFAAVIGLSFSSEGYKPVGELPHCDNTQKSSGYLLASTLDGKLTSIDAYGEVLWNIGHETGPLLESNIHNVELLNNGEWVRIIPSLTGSLYKFNGKTIDPIPISGDTLLKSSFMYSNDLVIAGGKDVRTYGVSSKSGNIIYECSLHGCSNKTNLKNDFEDIVVIERSNTVVRAHEARTGTERWNFSVGYHNVKIPQVNCLILDPIMDRLKFTAVAPKGVLMAYSNGQLMWEYSFTSPIVKLWKWNGVELTDIDLFSQMKPLTSSLASLSPAIYLGIFEKQLYVHESQRMIDSLQLELQETKTGSVSKSNSLIYVPYKSVSPTELKRYKTDTTAILELHSRDSMDGNGFYFYTQTDVICDGNLTKHKFAKFITNDILYWKEFLLIIMTIAAVNIFRYRGIFGLFQSSQYLQRERTSSETSQYNTPISNTSSTNTDMTPTNQDVNEVFTSRYLKDFDTVRCLGRGGYGVVFEVKQKIDECGYAIKRITLSKKYSSQERVLREVRALAKLDHPHIVRYCTSWVENPPFDWQFDYDKRWIGNDMSTMYSETTEESRQPQSKSLEKIDPFACSTVINISDDITFEKDSKAEEPSIGSLTDDSTNETEVSLEEVESVNDSGVQKCAAFLYIQMQLCKKESLKDWLNMNQKRQRGIILHIFNQILSAVDYVHQQKLIHRDLKPSNIFFSQQDHVKVGDFGLVTTMKGIESDDINQVTSTRSHTKGAGTYLYMSPEQLEGKKYDHKVDIFSLGIILFELLVSFSTEMERTRTLSDLRRNIYPDMFSNEHPKEQELLTRMLSKEPKERPDADDVRQFFNTEYKLNEPSYVTVDTYL